MALKVDFLDIPEVSPLQFTDTLMSSFVLQTEEVIAGEIEKFKKRWSQGTRNYNQCRRWHLLLC